MMQRDSLPQTLDWSIRVCMIGRTLDVSEQSQQRMLPEARNRNEVKLRESRNNYSDSEVARKRFRH